ncbi:hypothetical protein D1O30_07105 [Methylocystis hirsuta]|uniref:Uncharacterized protein n=1 Tax=Methylocystis hirsuta TaxID=369798 RepID=A0A3M9XNI9_9HYPH|nr:hypothetical protein D1O30_07105 [Methylocystis hirsuta]
MVVHSFCGDAIGFSSVVHAYFFDEPDLDEVGGGDRVCDNSPTVRQKPLVTNQVVENGTDRAGEGIIHRR